VMCPQCGVKTEVVKTAARLTAKEPTRRLRSCPCGYRGISRETWETHLPMDHGPLGAVTGNHGQLAPNDRQLGASYSSQDSDLSDPNPESVVNPKRAHVKAKRRVVEYSPEFERLWEATGKGHKEPAMKAWVAAGKPDVDEVITAWKAYLASLDEWRSPKDLSSWLNISGYKQTWRPFVKQVKPAAPAEPFAVRDERARTQRALERRFNAATGGDR
jgi:hypothetical protein